MWGGAEVLDAGTRELPHSNYKFYKFAGLENCLKFNNTNVYCNMLLRFFQHLQGPVFPQALKIHRYLEFLYCNVLTVS